VNVVFLEVLDIESTLDIANPQVGNDLVHGVLLNECTCAVTGFQTPHDWDHLGELDHYDVAEGR
jgi:hypothetical protein